MSTKKWLAATAMATASALLMAGCSGSTGGASGSAPTGEPIKILTGTSINSQIQTFPETQDVAKVYQDWINNRGGIDGRPLEITVCDDQFDPNLASGCARDAVSDGAVAVVGTSTPGMSDSYLPILEDAGIAWMPAYSIQPIEFSSPDSYPISSFNAVAVGTAVRAIDDGCKSITIIGSDVAAVDPLAKLAQDVGTRNGLTIRRVAVPFGAQDYSTVVAEAMDGGTDCLIGYLNTELPGFLTAMKSVGAKAKFYVMQRTPNDQVLAQYSDLLDGIIWSGAFPGIDSPAFDDYRAALDQAGLTSNPDRNWGGQAALGAWTAFTVFTQIAEKISGDVTAKSFVDAANSSSDIDTGGMLPPLDFTKEWAGQNGQAPRSFNLNVAYSSWKADGSGDAFIDGKFFDMSDQLQQSATK